MNNLLILKWNANFALYNFYLLLFNILTIILVIVTKLIIKYNKKIVNYLATHNRINFLIKFIVAIFVGSLNSISILFYVMFNNEINFIIISFIPNLLIITLTWSLTIGTVAFLPSLITYILVGYLNFNMTFLDVLTPIFMAAILLTVSVFLKIYNISSYWKLFLFQLLFHLIVVVMFSFTMKPLQNIYVDFNGTLISMEEINLSQNFQFYFVDVILSALVSSLINYVTFILIYLCSDWVQKLVDSTISINKMNTYENGFFYNYHWAKEKIRPIIAKHNFCLNLTTFFIHNKSFFNNIPFNEQKNIEQIIFKEIKYRLKKYNPILYVNSYGFYNFFIALDTLEISNNLNDIYKKKNKTLKELEQIFDKQIQIKYNDEKYNFSLKTFVTIIGIHTYDLNEVSSITYKLFKQRKDFDEKFIVYNHAVHNINYPSINFKNIKSIKKDYLKIELVKNENNEVNIIEPIYSYAPYLLLMSSDLFDYLTQIGDEGILIKRYLALETLKKFKAEYSSKKTSKIAIDFPEEIINDKQFNINVVFKKIRNLGITNSQIIWRFNKNDFFLRDNFLQNVKTLKKLGFKIWLYLNSINRKWISEINPDFISINKEKIRKNEINKLNNGILLQTYFKK